MIMLAGNLPVRPVRQLLHLLTLDQSWDVFAPDPTRTQLELRAAVEFSDGSETTWQPLHASPALSLLTYHWDAWANSAALGYPIAFRSVARWIAATSKGNARPVKVTLTRRWTELEPPGSDRPLLWHESDFYVYDVAQ